MLCYQQTKQVIPRMLELFATHEVAVTWATVGSLMADDEEEWHSFCPTLQPNYHHSKYSAYRYAAQYGIGQAYADAHFAPALVKEIVSYPRQELATHTYGHYYCLEAGQTLEAFKADMAAAQQLALHKFGQSLTSLVFPRNQYNTAYLLACHQLGITAVRSNPPNWFWTGVANDETSLVRKIFRTGDVFVPMGSSNSYPLKKLQKVPGKPLELPASRLYRQYDGRYPLLNVQRLKRIMGEMENAAKKGECYHLWWHPENFGFHPNECIAELNQLLHFFTILREKYGMQSSNMQEMAALLAAV